MKKVLWILLLSLYQYPAKAEVVRVAVASNFVDTLHKLADDFERQTGHELLISSASTGKLYAQIVHGAPFDVFMSADTRTAEKLIHQDLAEATSLMTYAQGQLVMLSNISSETTCQATLQSDQLKYLAVANPKTAPYGLAAQQVLQKLGLLKKLKSKFVTGENIAQTMQFVATKNAQAGLVAHSLVIKKGLDQDQCMWNIPTDMYQAINQSLVRVKRSGNDPAIKAFLSYLKTATAQETIRSFGYGSL